jgi:hypothetical protein
MDNGLELTADGYVLHPKASARRIAALVGLAGLILGLVIGGIVASSARHSTLLLAGVVALVFTLFAGIGWFTSLPPTLTVSRDGLSLLGGRESSPRRALAYQERQPRPRASTPPGVRPNAR